MSLSSIAIADLDGDTDLDVVLAGEDNVGDPTVRQYRNTTITSIADNEGRSPAALRLFPNPTRGLITSQYRAATYAQALYALLDCQGRVVHQETHTLVPGLNETRLDLMDHAPGMYLLRLVAEGQVVTGKIMVQ